MLASPAPPIEAAAALAPVSVTVGARYWRGAGRLAYDVGSPRVSRLDYRAAQIDAGELFARVATPRGPFLKGAVALGRNTGALRDQDYVAGLSAAAARGTPAQGADPGLTYSDVRSAIDGGALLSGLVDAGVALPVLLEGARLTVFAGYGYWREVFKAQGAVCQPTTSLLNTCGAPGSTRFPASVSTIRNEARWNLLRVGVEASWRLGPRVSLSGEAAAVPYGGLTNDDSHYLRTDLGLRTPNFHAVGHGYGVQAQVFLDYAVTPRLTVSAGWRGWSLRVNRTVEDVGNPVQSQEYDYDWRHTLSAFSIGSSYRW